MRIRVYETGDFPLLQALGGDLAGAVQVVPSESGVVSAQTEEADAVAPVGPLRFSLAGVQLKLSALEAATGGLTIPAHGAGGEWILKLPSPVYDRIPENEHEEAAQVGLTNAARIAIDRHVASLPIIREV